MLNKTSRWTLVIIMILGCFLLKTGRTSADLTAQRTVKNNRMRATTLALAEQHTANFSLLTTLFNTTGYLPGGFDIRAIKLAKTGELSFKYQLKMEGSDNVDPLCHSLTIKVLKNWIETYNGPLLNFTTEATIPDIGNDDWIFVLSFPEGDENIKNSNCVFNLVARTWRNDPNENFAGFWSKKQLANLVTTGSW